VKRGGTGEVPAREKEKRRERGEKKPSGIKGLDFSGLPAKGEKNAYKKLSKKREKKAGGGGSDRKMKWRKLLPKGKNTILKPQKTARVCGGNQASKREKLTDHQYQLNQPCTGGKKRGLGEEKKTIKAGEPKRDHHREKSQKHKGGGKLEEGGGGPVVIQRIRTQGKGARKNFSRGKKVPCTTTGG